MKLKRIVLEGVKVGSFLRDENAPLIDLRQTSSHVNQVVRCTIHQLHLELL